MRGELITLTKKQHARLEIIRRLMRRELKQKAVAPEFWDKFREFRGHVPEFGDMFRILLNSVRVPEFR